ncbi:YggN family protein [Thalassomonas sp. M1454]|uniref:YggN family protein n=1 Tax=Thalassomonas sp. M1454 TaxID=2594477 RepID=UPI00163DE4AE|nr:YggN family protein [Thalassomonas sp. M1454]
MKKLLLAGLTATLLSSQVMAHDNDHHSFSSDNCAIDFNYSVIVEDKSIRFLQDKNTYVQINNQQQLFVKGKEVDLNDQQQKLLNEYAQGVHQQVPEIVDIALDAVEIAFSAVSHVVKGFSGEDAKANQRIESIFTKITEKVHTRFNNEDGYYFLAEQDFNEVDQFIEDELEQEIEAVVTNSIGDLLTAVGSAMNSEEGNFEENMEAFGERMERMGDDIEAEVEDKAQELGAKAELVCTNLKTLDKVESELTDSVAELENFNLISVTE